MPEFNSQTPIVPKNKRYKNTVTEVDIDNCPKLIQALTAAVETVALQKLVAHECGVLDPSLSEANKILTENEMVEN